MEILRTLDLSCTVRSKLNGADRMRRRVTRRSNLNRPEVRSTAHSAPYLLPSPTVAPPREHGGGHHRSTARQHDDVPKRERVGAKRSRDDGGPWRGKITGRRVHQNPGDGGWRHDGGEEAPVKNRRRPVPVLDPTASRTPVLRPCAHAEPRSGSGSALESRDDGEVTPRRKDFLTQQREPTAIAEGDGVWTRQ